ncbi:hypothetical protein ABDJ41_18610 [Pedobacter sp. ASV1-7]|uniref:DUF6922 domain-containing protein n=1 Tax=Pedobacter sp. ASV1-7 TaxID=3145237 RepID=UPI0032E89F02
MRSSWMFVKITKNRRRLTPEISLKIDRDLGLEEGKMFLLQAYYTIKLAQHKDQIKLHPDLDVIRKILFWDTDISKIDWQKQYKSVIQRVFERGNTQEKKEILNFYGKEKVKEVTGGSSIYVARSGPL